MIALTTFVLSVVGFAALALSMHRHHRDVFGKPPVRWRKWTFGAAGWVLLSASVVHAVAGDGVSVGLTSWFAIITPAILLVGFGLTYASRIFAERLPRRRSPAVSSERRAVS